MPLTVPFGSDVGPEAVVGRGRDLAEDVARAAAAGGGERLRVGGADRRIGQAAGGDPQARLPLELELLEPDAVELELEPLEVEPELAAALVLGEEWPEDVPEAEADARDELLPLELPPVVGLAVALPAEPPVVLVVVPELAVEVPAAELALVPVVAPEPELELEPSTTPLGPQADRAKSAVRA